MHDAYLDEEGLALAVAIITWIIVTYIALSERLQLLHDLYNIMAVLVLDGVMVILWLSTFAAVAAKRAKFVYDVTVDGCFNDGSLFNSETCFKKRDVILFKNGEDMLSAIAGLGALVWLLFIATFAWTLTGFLRGRKEGRFLFDSGVGAPQTFAMESKQDQQFQQQQAIQSQPAAQGQYPQQIPSPYPPAQSPYQQQPPYSPPQGQQTAYNQYPPQQQFQPQAYQAGSPPAATPPPLQQPPYQAP